MTSVVPDMHRPAADGEPVFTGHLPGPAYRRLLIALFCAGVATFGQLHAPQGALPSISRELHIDSEHAAWLVSAATLGVAVGVLPWSWIGDRAGRVPAMRWALIASTVIGLLVPFWPGLTGVIVLRFVEGLALAGLPALAIAHLQEQIDPAHTVAAAGTYIAGTSCGGLAGRLIAGPLAAVAGWRVGVGAVSLVSIAATIVFVLAMPPTRGALTHRRPAGTGLGLGALLHRADLLAMWLQGFAFMGAFYAVYNFLGYRLQAPPFSLPATLTAFMFLTYLAGTVTSRQAGRLAARHGRSAVLAAGALVLIAGVLLTLTSSLALVIVGLLLVSAGFFVGHAVASGWVGARAHRAAPGLPAVGTAQAAAVYTLVYYVGAGLGGQSAGAVDVRFGWNGTAALVVALMLLSLVITALDPQREGRPARP